MWRKDKYAIAVAVDKSKFTLWAGTDEHTDEPFVAFGLADNKGSVIDSWYVDESDEDYQVVQQLYKAANRHALGVPNRLKELNAIISGLKIVGEPDDDI